MKRLIVALCMALPFFGNAQNTEGKIIFQERIKIDFEGKVDEETMQQPGMKEMIKKFQEQASKSKGALIFKSGESFYRKFDAEKDAEVNWTSEGGEFEMRMMDMRPSSMVYRNADQVVEQHNFFGKLFLIEEEPEALKWKMTGESEMIAGYMCQKATSRKDTLDVVAWFAPQIPVSAGPKMLAGLPGMILKAVLGDEVLTYEAVKVDLSEQSEVVEVPTKGKKVTREEFEALAEEKMKEMEKMYGGRRRGGGGMHMRIER